MNKRERKKRWRAEQKRKRSELSKLLSSSQIKVSTTPTKSVRRTVSRISDFPYLKLTLQICGVITFAFFVVTKWHWLFTSKHDLDKEERTIQGLLLSGEILKSEKVIKIMLGAISYQLEIDSMRNGIPYRINLFDCALDPTDQAISLKLVFKDNRLFVIDTIRNLESGEVVGVINKNKWSLFKGHYLDYYSDDKLLEVYDNQGRVALSLNLVNAATLNFNGYFRSLKHVGAKSDKFLMSCLSVTDTANLWRVFEVISSIKPVHPKDD